MPNLLDVAIDFAPDPKDASIQRLDSYLSLVLRPAIDELLKGPSTEIAKMHRPETHEKTIYVVHYTSLATLYSIINKQIAWNSCHKKCIELSRDAAPLEAPEPMDTAPEPGPVLPPQ